MKMHEPIGEAIYGPLLIRATLGAYFVLAGLAKLDNMAEFIAEVRKFEVLPGHLAEVYAILLPYVEISAGVLMIFGLWTTLAAITTSLMLLSFIVALGAFPKSDHLFNKDIILLAASLSLLYTGSGAFSVDRFRKMG